MEKSFEPALLPLPTGVIEEAPTGKSSEPALLPPPLGVSSEAPPMILDPAPIKAVVYGSVGCICVGYLVWLYCLASGLLKDWPWPLQGTFALHTVLVFGLLLRYFGGSMKVTSNSAETGR